MPFRLILLVCIFINMIKTDSYSMLINHKGHEVKEVYESTEVATFEVMVLDKEKKIL